MPTYPWESLLTEWNSALFKAVDIEDYALPPDVRRSRWLGFPGASETEIAAAEARLGTATFPPSYREFLSFTNGWRTTGTFIDRLWSTQVVDWLRVRHGDVIDSFSDDSEPELTDAHYFDYDDDETVTYIRSEHLSTLVEISDMGDAALYLLNPKIRSNDGEWEAWFYASWLPGFRRYPSFWALMQAEYASFKRLEARRRMEQKPAQAATILRELSPELVQELERVARLMGKPQQGSQGGVPLDPAYVEGYVHALRDTAQRVQRVIDENPNAKAFLKELRRLMTTLGHEADALQPKMGMMQLTRIGADPATMKQAIADGGQ